MNETRALIFAWVLTVILVIDTIIQLDILGNLPHL